MFTIVIFHRGQEWWLNENELTYSPCHFEGEFPESRLRLDWDSARRLADEFADVGWDRVEIVQLEKPEYHLDPA